MQYNRVETFLQEAEELLAEIARSALFLETGEATEETVNQLFRAFHGIKGSGAMCGLDATAGFTHHLENLPDRGARRRDTGVPGLAGPVLKARDRILPARVRDGAIPVSPALAGPVLKARDRIRILLGAEQGGAAVPIGSRERLIAAIEEFADSGPAARPGRAPRLRPRSRPAAGASAERVQAAA